MDVTGLVKKSCNVNDIPLPHEDPQRGLIVAPIFSAPPFNIILVIVTPLTMVFETASTQPL